MLQTKIAEKIETSILCSAIFFFFENRVVYEKMWKNVIDRGRPQMSPWCMPIACWIHKATNTHKQFVSYSLHFQCNNVCTNAPQCYVIRTLSVFFPSTIVTDWLYNLDRSVYCTVRTGYLNKTDYISSLRG